jgi:hypothetical protein
VTPGDQDPRHGTTRAPLRLVRGEATPEEVAAVLAVLSAVTGEEPRATAGHPSPWASHERALRGRLTGGWRASGLPQ